MFREEVFLRLYRIFCRFSVAYYDWSINHLSSETVCLWHILKTTDNYQVEKLAPSIMDTGEAINIIYKYISHRLSIKHFTLYIQKELYYKATKTNQSDYNDTDIYKMQIKLKHRKWAKRLCQHFITFQQSWALPVFFHFSIIKNEFFSLFIKLITYFSLHFNWYSVGTVIRFSKLK